MRCQTCGAQVATDARFCATCGTEVPQPASAPIADEERKVITVLFADLAGFTAASELADPEDVAARLSLFHNVANDTVERFGGRVEKLLGDGVFAVFGAPVAHEDDPVRGARAALRIQDKLSDLNRRDESLALGVRAAVTTGEAIVVLSGTTSSREGIVGDVVNTASRLQEVAPIGGVVVDERTHSASNRIIDYERLQPAEVKGKREPIPIWLAKSLRSRMGIDTETDESLFVGREDELEVLTSSFGRVTETSETRLVTIVGEPGVGKSRLVNEFSSHVDQLPDFVSWRQGRCLPYGEGATYGPLAEIVKAQAGILESDPAETASRKLDQSLEMLYDDADLREWLRLRLSPLVGVSTGASTGAVTRDELFSAWSRYIAAIAEETPLVLVVEDLHWADPAMVDFLSYLIDEGVHAPLFVLVTARPEVADRHPGWGSTTVTSETVSLSPLADEDMRRIVRSLLEEAELSEGIQTAVLERSEGNPLYAGEFVRMLRQRDLLVRENGKVSLRKTLPMPESLQALIAARIDALIGDEKSALQAASVVGKVFWAECVSSMLGRHPTASTTLMEELTRKEMIRPVRPSSMQGQSEHTFWHALVRDVGYSQIPRPRRMTLHMAAAEWIQSIAAERLRDVAEILALHYTEALALAGVARIDEATELREQARKYLRLAGDRSMDLDAMQALRFYQRALELTDPEDFNRAELISDVGRAEVATGQIDQGIDRLYQASEAFREAGNDLAEAQTLARLKAAVWMKGDAAQVDALNRRALELIEGHPPSAEAATVLAGAVSTKWLRGDPEGALALADHALEISRGVGSPEDLANVYTSIGAAKNHAGIPGGIADMEQALEIALRHGLTRSAVSIYNNLGDNTLYMEGTTKPLKYLDEGIRLAKQRGLASAGHYIRMTRLDVLCYSGRWDELIAEADDLSAEVGTETQVSVGAQAWTLPARAYRGDAVGAFDKAERVIAKAQQVKDAQWAKVLLMGAIVLEHGGQANRVVSIVEEFAQSTEGRDSFRTEMLPMATRLLIAHGETDRAEEITSGVRSVNRYGELSLMSSGALVAEANGDIARAYELHSSAAPGWGDWGSPLEEGYSWAGVARTSDDTTEAETAHATARNLFESLEAVVSLKEIGLLVSKKS